MSLAPEAASDVLTRSDEGKVSGGTGTIAEKSVDDLGLSLDRFAQKWRMLVRPSQRVSSGIFAIVPAHYTLFTVSRATRRKLLQPTTRLQCK
jgi:hypothetical protein